MRECNPQLAIINSLDVPIIVQAGAGSGKTYTLTERIVNFLKEGGDIESVVAITFTKKAAEELKSRIRGRLEEEGMHVQALKVDDAYISTIHGFASKILKENALSFSMDPNLEVIDEAKNNYIANNAIKQAIYYVASGKQFAKEIDSQTNIIANAEVFDEDAGDEEFDSSGFKSIDLNPTGSLIGAIAGQIQEALGDILKEASSKILSQSAVSMLTKEEIGTVDALEKSVAEILEKIELIPFFDEERIFLGKRIEYDEIFTKLNQLVKGFLNRIEFKTTKQDQNIEIAFVDLIREMEDLNFRLITKDKSLNLKKELNISRTQ